MTNRKTMTFAIVHMSVAFGVVYLMTGSLALGGAVALVEPLINTMPISSTKRSGIDSRSAGRQSSPDRMSFFTSQ